MSKSGHTAEPHDQIAEKGPRWSLQSVFPGFDSTQYTTAKDTLARYAREALAHLDRVPSLGDQTGFEEWLLEAIERENAADALSRTLSSYCNAIYTTDTADSRAMAEINALEELQLPFAKAGVLFLNILAERESAVRMAIQADPRIGGYRFYLEEALFWQQKQMSAAEEDLAADLARSGVDAWGRLHEQLTSSAECVWDEKTGERKTLTDLRALAYDKDRAVRAKAFAKETEVCASIAMTAAACLNGIKGTSITLSKRRKWESSLGKSIKQGRLSEKALRALISTMEESLPLWRRYLGAKARLMGIEKCAFYDLFAPMGSESDEYDWNELTRTITETFSTFSPAMGNFAKKAFESQWIDAERRPGKVGGAYCTDMPLVKETRILCNFDKSFSSVTTVAHELGHAFHSDVVKDLPPLEQDYPMTLAETASIFAETVLFTKELAKAGTERKLAMLEMHLQDGCQILVDILSRYYFENSVMEARKKSDLSVEEISGLMRLSQEKTYGEGLASDGYHPYMWVVKPHYYFSGLDFYNFPYAFGQLFALALFSRFEQEGSAFAQTYEDILRETGRMDAVSLTAKAGFDIETAAFWKSGIDVFAAEIDEFERLVSEWVSTHGKEKSK